MIKDTEYLRDKIKATEKWIADEEDNMRRMERRHRAERTIAESELEKARNALKRNQARYNEATGDPWCNHGAMAVVNGVCECGVRV